MLYKKKPVVIEAFQLGMMLEDPYEPEWFLDAEKKGSISVIWDSTKGVFGCTDPLRQYYAQTCVIKTLEGDMRANEGDYVIKGVNGELYPCKPDIFAKTYETADKAEDPQMPTHESTSNRLLNAFPRPEALNEIYSTGDVDHRGVPVNYSIWRGNHSIMGMTGILFEKGFVEEGDYQEGVEDTDLLEMVYDRLTILADYLEGTDNCLIDTALLNIENAIGNIVAYQAFYRDIGDISGC